MPICCISQPRFFPGLHYLHRMMVADIFVILDTVQFDPRHEENRTKLKAPSGTQWLTVPMCQSSQRQLIINTRIHNEQPWQRKFINTLSTLYSKTKYYPDYIDEITSIINSPHETLTQLDCASWEPAIRQLGITCQFVRSSELPMSGKGWQLLLDICKYLDADTYLSGAFGRDYLDRAAFAEQGVEVRFHEYRYPIYQQRFGDFVPFVSYLDMLFNVGLERDTVLAGGSMLPF